MTKSFQRAALCSSLLLLSTLSFADDDAFFDELFADDEDVEQVSSDSPPPVEDERGSGSKSGEEPTEKSEAGNDSSESEPSPESETVSDEANLDGPPPVAVRRRPVLEEIIVTSQKREESLQDVPISVIAFTAEAMADANITDMKDLSKFAPNVDAGSLPPFSSVTVRGLGSSFDKGFEHSAGVFMDGVYVGRLAFLDVAFLDVASVEVLRGPQGSLFGKNTITGAISIQSVRPSDEFEVNGSLLSGTYGQMNGTLNANLPVTDNFALRASLLSTKNDGTHYNTALDRREDSEDKQALRLQARWDGSDLFSMNLAATRIQQEYKLGKFQVYVVTDAQRAAMTASDPDFETDPTNYQSSLNYPSQAVQNASKYDLHLNWDIAGGQLTSISSRTTLDEIALTDLDFSPLDLLFYLNGEDYALSSTELRYVSDLGLAGGKFDYITGVYFGRAKTLIDVIIDASNNGQNAERLDIDGVQDSDSYAVYGSGNWNINDAWSMNLGLRYSQEDKEVAQEQKLFVLGLETPTGGPVFAGLVGAEPYVLIDSRSDKDFSPKLGVRWLPTDDATFYGSIARGFKSGGYSGSAVRADIAEVEPEESITFEIGSKLKLLEGAASLNLAVFRTEFEDLQLNTFQGSTTIISNASGAISEGVEMDTSFITPWGVHGSLSLAWLDARFTDYSNGACPAGQDPPCDQTGTPLVGAPEWAGNLSLNYTFNLPADMALSFGGDMQYTGSRWLQADHDPIDQDDSFTLFNARASLSDASGAWAVQALVKNVTERVTNLSSGDIPTQTGAHYALANDPREVEVTLRYNF
jgi:iron complex outermembrane receptor protein